LEKRCLLFEMARNDSAGSRSTLLFNLSLPAWQRLRAKYPEPLNRRLVLRTYVASLLVYAMEGMQERLFGAKLDAIAVEPPIFIIGHWRTGSTLLHEMLGLDERLLFPTTYQCFNAQSFLISADSSRRSKAAAVRPSGDRIVRADSPQEEEFALLCLGCVSPYEAFLFPKALQVLGSLCHPDGFSEPERTEWGKRFVRFLKAVSLGDEGRRLLLKSPSNSFRTAMLRRMFPNAAFVQIVREPTAMIVSAVDMWEKMWMRYALTPSPGRAAISKLVMDAYLDMESKLGDHITACPNAISITVRYEELVASPGDTIERIYGALKFTDAGRVIDRASRFVAGSPTLRQHHSVSREQAVAVRDRCSALFERYGY
jgi:omega-hydroxy-beta-dihydromenaquinone-9 sulfotransferase